MRTIQTRKASRLLNQRIYELMLGCVRTRIIDLTARMDRKRNKIRSTGSACENFPDAAADRAGNYASGAQGRSGIPRNSAQVVTVAALRSESGALTARVEGCRYRLKRGLRRITESEVRIEALRQSLRSRRQLARLHGRPEAGQEALVHQAAALQKLETNGAACSNLPFRFATAPSGPRWIGKRPKRTTWRRCTAGSGAAAALPGCANSARRPQRKRKRFAIPFRRREARHSTLTQV